MHISDDDGAYSSDESEFEGELSSLMQRDLMNRDGLVESAVHELTLEHRLSIMDEIGRGILQFNQALNKESEKFITALAQIDRVIEVRQEVYRQLDNEYQRSTAEALDNHLTDIHRDHEKKSQMEEKKIRDDAALEEAKRKKALQEEKVQQEKMKAKAELILQMQARADAEKKRVQQANVAAEALKRPAKEDAEKVVHEPLKEVIEKNENEALLKPAAASGNVIKAASSALELEKERLQIHNQLVMQKNSLPFSTTGDIHELERLIRKRINTVAGSKANLRIIANELIKIFSSSFSPQAVLIFTKKIGYNRRISDTSPNMIFAYAYLVVLVTSKVPFVMDIVLAELNRACIFTVPKYYNKSYFETTEAFYKAIGYEENNGKIESLESYLERLRYYMKLYGALVQTQVEDVQNLHGIECGWAWCARFLNTLPANQYTATALHSFLEMAGFALHRKYKRQFGKVLDIISREFLTVPEGAHRRLREYLDSNKFLEEPVGKLTDDICLSASSTVCF